MDSLKIITDKAHELFLQFGVRRVSMDEIANSLGMSKKTVYRFYANKDALVTTIVEKEIEENTLDNNILKSKKEDAIIQLFFTMTYARKTYLGLNALIIDDLRKYYTRVYEIIHRHKNDFIYRAINQCLTEGIKQRLFNDDFNVDLMARFFLESIPMVSDVSLFPEAKQESKDLAGEIFGHLIRGISTQEGMELINHYRTQRDLFMLFAPKHNVYWNA